MGDRTHLWKGNGNGSEGVCGGDARPAHFPGARCLGSGLNFYPTRTVRGRGGNRGTLVEVSDESPVKVAPLRELCRRCPWPVECLAVGLTQDEFGVWGGTTTRERERLRSFVTKTDGGRIGERCPGCGGVYTWKRPREPWECGHCDASWR